MIDQVYNQVLPQLARGYKFIIKDDELSIRMSIKTIDIML